MTTTGPDRTRRPSVRPHAKAFASVICLTAVSGAALAAALGAPLVSFLLAGLLLICPLLIWVPFGRRPDRRDPGAGGEEP